jgi:hypothetical protein
MKDLTDTLRADCDAVALVILLLSLAMGADRAVARLFAEQIAGPTGMVHLLGDGTAPCPETADR